MKRIGFLFDQVTSLDALHAGYLEARRGKRACRSVYQFERHLGSELLALHRELNDGSYAPRPYHHFWVYEPKPRQISAPAFRDRVVQHSLYRVVRPIFEPTFVPTSFACRPGLGTHAAADYVQSAIQQSPRDSYLLQLDVRRYYYCIDHQILRRLVGRRIKDARTVDLWMQFADTGDGSGIGLPIGCLMSQLNGLIYLNPLDQFIKRELQISRYARYVDDFVLIGQPREILAHCHAEIVRFLADHLHLSLSHAHMAPIARGLNFVGYRTWSIRRFIRKRALYNYRRALRRGDIESATSSIGHARRTASLGHMLDIARSAHASHLQLPQGVRRLYHLRDGRAGRGEMH